MSQPQMPLGNQRVCPTCDGTGVVDGDYYRRLIEDREGKIGRVHPHTARTAARQPSNVITFGSQRYRVLEILAADGAQTAAEVAPKLRMSRNQCATRLLELREVGMVEYVRGEDGTVVSRPTGPTDRGLVQRISHAGREALR